MDVITAKGSSEERRRGKGAADAFRIAVVATTLVGGLLGSVPAGAIVGGQPDEGRHPAVGALVGYFPPAGKEIAYCSGTLLSPRVFLTAAHCGFLGPEVKVTFDEKYDSDSQTHGGTFIRHPNFRSYGNTPVNDVAVVILHENVGGIDPARLPSELLLDKMTLNQRRKFTAVGYGDTEYLNGPGGKRTTHVQARYYAVGSFNALTPRALHLSQNSATGDGGTCSGDSGGPNFIGAGAEETTIIAGVTSTGDTFCKATNVAQRVDIPSVRGFLDDYLTLP